jgi:alpha-tubulin suppressor-like RCC1 family protein
MTTSLKFVGLAAGTGHTCGITDEGFLYCWGDNQRGELGTGNHTPSPVPVRVKEPGV